MKSSIRKKLSEKTPLLTLRKKFLAKQGFVRFTRVTVCMHLPLHIYTKQELMLSKLCSITEHKNESTLSDYITTISDIQKRNGSRILSSTFVPSTKAMEPHSTPAMSTVTDATSPSCHELMFTRYLS